MAKRQATRRKRGTPISKLTPAMFQPAMFWGTPGMGKTYHTPRGWHEFSRVFAGNDPSDFSGLPHGLLTCRTIPTSTVFTHDAFGHTEL